MTVGRRIGRFARLVCVNLAVLLAVGGIRAHVVGADTPAGQSLHAVHKGLDPCLVGIWYVADYESYWASIFGKELKHITQTGMEGIRYKANGDAIVAANHFKITGVMKSTGVPMGIELIGQGSARWRIPNKNQIAYSNVDMNFKEVLTVGTGSSTIPLPDSNLISTARPLRYACGKHFLEVWQLPGHPPIILSHSRP